jgi:WD40 repeat protein
MAGFSPDGKWLVTNGDGQIWASDRWRPIAKLSPFGAFAFSPDCNLLAVDAGYGVTHLIDPASGREYARLEGPEQDRTEWLCFSADGGQLLTTSWSGQSIHIWDLREIRAELATMDLDWNLPPYPPPVAEDQRPLRLEIDFGPPGQE